MSDLYDAEDPRAFDPDLPGDVETDAPSEAGGESGGNGEAIDYKDRWLRAEAELHNYRRRARREIDDARRSAEEAILLELIRWLDDLERALAAARADGAAAAITDGIALVVQKGRDALERHGVVLVDPAGRPFDPQLHEAILEVDPADDTPPGHVVQVVQKGYRRGDRPLRAARVVVARARHDES
jgi:molecular chaperone GrpE